MASIISENYLVDQISNLKQPEIDIHRAFNRHISLIFAKKWEILDEITQWGEKNIAQIEEHVEQQKKIVEQEYAVKITNLNSVRSHMLKHVVHLVEQQNTEQINQLLSQCQNLKEELVKIKYIVVPVSTIKVFTDEKVLEQNSTDSIPQEIKNETPENNASDSIPIDDSVLDEMNQLLDFTPNSTSIPPPTPATPPNAERFILVENNNENDNRSTMDNVIIDKCPLCLMIFSANMDINQRGVHINEHYND